MEDLLYLLIALSGFGVIAWQRHRPRGAPRRHTDEALEIAMHVSGHEAKVRKQVMEPMHLLYGLIQDEELKAWLTGAGANVDAMEKLILEDLDRIVATTRSGTFEISVEARGILNSAFAVAAGESRRVGCLDVFGALMRAAPSVAAMCDASGVPAVDLLVRFVHGAASADVPEAARLAVVLVNDNFTTMEFVVDVLEQVFELDREEAIRSMLAVHQGGRARLGPYPADDARQRQRRATEMARAQRFPLLLRLEQAD